MPPPAPDRPDKPPKDGKEGKDAKKLKSLAAEVAALRADVEALKSLLDGRATVAPKSAAPAAVSARAEGIESHLRGALKSPIDAAVLFGVAYRHQEAGIAGTHSRHVASLADALRADSERIARLGYAFSSPPKVALIRFLLAEGPQSAAQLGEKAGLSTGSLYHHLRELVHAEVAQQAGRNQYVLTPLGQQAALLLFALASGEG